MRSIPSGRGFSVASQMLTVVKDGLVLNVDAGDTNSYPGTGVIWSDRSVKATSLTLVNGPSFTAATSAVGANIGFDGVDDYADGLSPAIESISNGGDFTVDMWIKFNSAATTQLVCGNTSTAVDGIGGFGLALVASAGTCLIRINYKTSTNLFTGTTSTGLSTGTWRHIVVRFTYNIGGVFAFNSNYNVYVNNSEFFNQNNVTPSGTVASSNNFFMIGRRPNGTQPANINIGALKVYNRLLTTTEIAQNYNALRGRFGL
jgi:hypothetical protein